MSSLFARSSRCLAAVLLLSTLLFPACSSDASDQTGSQASAETPEAVIGVSVLTLTHPFFQDLTDAMQEAAAQHNYATIITAGEFDIARQQNQIADFIVQGVDAIVLSPVDSKAIGTSIAEANEAGIPVFTADIATIADGVDIVSHVATNNYEGGRLAAEAVLEAIGGSGRVAIIDHPEVESVIMRTQGFHDALDEANADIEVVAQLPGGGLKDRAFRVAEDLLQAYPNLDAIFAINDDTALGAIAAIEKAGRTGRVQVVGFDGTTEARKAIRDGKIYADVVQHPREIGRRTIQAIDQYRSGEDVEAELLIPASLYRQADAAADSSLTTPTR